VTAGGGLMTHRCDVAIVGGGIAGLTLAVSLARRSMSVQVFEQETELRAIGAGIGLGGNATRLLEDLGVDAASVANVPPALEFRRWRDGEMLWAHPAGDWYRSRFGAPFLTLHRATFQQLLAAAVPPGCIHLNHQLDRLSDQAAGVRLHFRGGREAIASVVIWADGVNSSVRRHVCGDVRTTCSGEIGLRGLISLAKAKDLPNPASLHIWCGPGTHAVYYGLGRTGLVNLLAVYRPDPFPAWAQYTSRAATTKQEALGIFERYAWDRRILELIHNIEGEVSFWALREVPRLSGWSRGRVILVGDAAHAPLPHQGQGAGQAIEDAHALGELLARTGLRAYQLAFEAFELLRRGRTGKVQAYSRLAGQAMKLGGGAALRRDARWPSLPRQIGWIHSYRGEEAVASLCKAAFPDMPPKSPTRSLEAAGSS
jgi:salicylate hydroxylase